MSPGKEHQEQFIDDIRVRNIKVMLESRDINVAIKLLRVSFRKGRFVHRLTFCSTYS